MRATALLVLAVVLSARTGEALPLRVLAASETRIEPRVRADGTALDVDVQVRNDRGVPEHGEVRLVVQSVGASERTGLQRETDERGVATFTVPVTAGDHVFDVTAEFAGAEDVAASRDNRRVNLDAPFISLDLIAPGIVDLDERRTEFVASIQIGEIRLASVDGREVALVVDGRIVQTARADGAGRVVFHPSVAAFGAPGVRTVVARHFVAGEPVDSPPRRVVVRAATGTTLERVGERADAVTLVGAVATRFGPVPRAAVRLLWGGHVVGGAVTGDDGSFTVTPDPDLLAQPGVSVRAVFEPTEPWYLASESPVVAVTARTARSVRWTLAAVPVLVALALAAALRWRRRSGASVLAPAPTVLGDEVQLSQEERGGSVARVRLEVIDRSTHGAVAVAEAEWRQPPHGSRPAGDAVDAPGSRFEVTVRASGYAPRVVTGPLTGGGVYTLRVALRPWREELFERLRQWIRSGAIRDGAILPTPREALHAAGAQPAVQALVEAVEAGAYGPFPPDATEVERVDTLAQAAGRVRTGER